MLCRSESDRRQAALVSPSRFAFPRRSDESRFIATSLSNRISRINSGVDQHVEQELRCTANAQIQSAAMIEQSVTEHLCFRLFFVVNHSDMQTKRFCSTLRCFMHANPLRLSCHYNRDVFYLAIRSSVSRELPAFLLADKVFGSACSYLFERR